MVDRSNWTALLVAMRDTIREVSTVPKKGQQGDAAHIANQAQFDKVMAEIRAIRFNPAASDDEVWNAIHVHPYFGFFAPPPKKKIDAAKVHLSDYRKVGELGWMESAPGRAYANDASAYFNNYKTRLPVIIRAAQTLLRHQRLNNQRPLIENIVPEPYRDFSPANLRSLFKRAKDATTYGNVTVFHMLTDLGVPVVKPDRMLIRTAVRLGMITHEGDKLNRKRILLSIDTQKAGKLASDMTFVWELQDLMRELADETGVSIREIDILFAKMGMVPKQEDGRETTICDDVPKCKSCLAHSFCAYGQKYQPMKKAA